ncbi:MAG: hypothetical protein K2M19_06075 [Muribaculaceae bacterium]|nr:hypothetical protein [Muribaculaceae bacterium]
MKKFYAFAAAAMATVAMNAQTLYVCGAGEGLGWTPETPMEVAAENGAYTFEVKSLTQFKISTAMGDWNTFNAAAFTCEYHKEDLGKAVALVAGDGNIGTPWKGDYKLVVVLGDNPTLTMTTDTPEPTGDPEMYFRGGMNNWGNDGLDETWQLTSKGAGKYEFVAKDATKIEAGIEFKIADADWDKFNYGLGLVTVNTYEEMEDGDEVGAHWNYNGDNSSVAEDFEGTVLVTVDLSNTTAGADVIFLKNYFAGDGVESALVEANEARTFYNLQGVKVENPTQGIYVVRQGGKAYKAIVK